MINYQKRKTIDLTVAEFMQTRAISYELVRICTNNNKPIDIGSIAYSRRVLAKEIKPKDVTARGVELGSLRKERLFFIQEFIESLSTKRLETQKTYLKITGVFDWADECGYSDLLVSPTTLNKAYFAFTNHLFERILTHGEGSIKVKHAKAQQRNFEKIISLSFPDNVNEITAGVQKVHSRFDNESLKDKSLTDGTLNKHWDVNYALFKQMKSFAMDKEPMPFKLVLPDFESYWFPNNSDSAVNSPLLKKKKLSRYYDYISGEFYEYEQLNEKIRAEYKKQNKKFYHFKKDYNNSIKCFNAINTDKRSYWRVQNGLLAMKAFMQLFRIMTCANQQTIMDLDVSGATQKDFTQSEFKSIKYRAGNREVSYRLHKHGYKLYLEYLKLRTWLLNGRDFDNLFFTFGEQHNSSEPIKINPFLSRSFYRVLERKGYVATPFSMLKDNELRNAKSVTFKKLGYSLKQAADMLNHDLATSEKVYSSISEEEQVKEYKAYWGALKKVNIVRHEEIKSETAKIASGHCENKISHPESIIDSPPIQPDCETPQGCLFCKYFVVHAESDDLRKLFSLQFIIESVFLKTVDWEHAYSVFSLVILRIKEIINQVSALSDEHAQLVVNIQDEIYEYNELTPFWDNRLQQYINAGVIR